jgi:hypothetical protein
MTNENIAVAFNRMDHELAVINKRLDEMPDKIMDKMKLWILSAIISVLITGILIPIATATIIHIINK